VECGTCIETHTARSLSRVALCQPLQVLNDDGVVANVVHPYARYHQGPPIVNLNSTPHNDVFIVNQSKNCFDLVYETSLVEDFKTRSWLQAKTELGFGWTCLV
jgi:hypothetical protein